MRKRRQKGGVAIVLLTVIVEVTGCSDDPAADGGDTVSVALPLFTPCPEGWTATTIEGLDGLLVCEPFPEGVPESCEAPDEAHFVGESGCTRIGTACPGGDWAEDLPDDATVVYVRPDGTADGDGSQPSPYGSLADAVAAAAPGDIVALAKGTYEESVDLTQGVTLWGACVAETILAAPDYVPSELPFEPTRPVIRVDAADVVLRNLTIGGPNAGVVFAEDATAEVADLVVRETGGAGWVLQPGSSVSGRSVLFEDTQPPQEGRPGSAVWAFSAHVDLERAAFEGNAGIGVSAEGPNLEVALVDTHISNTVPVGGLGGGDFAIGLGVSSQSEESDNQLRLERVYFQCNAAVAISLELIAAQLDDVVVRGRPEGVTCPTKHGPDDPEQADFTGVFLGFGVEAELARVYVERTGAIGLGVLGASVTVSDGVISQSAIGRADPSAGTIHLGGSLEFDRVALLDGVGVGILVREDFDGGAANLTARDVHILAERELDCEGEACVGGTLGFGVSVQDGATMSLTNFDLADSQLGVQVTGTGQLDLSTGYVRRNTIGVNLQTAGDYDVDRLNQDVRYLDNELNLDSSQLPVPSAEAILGFDF